jgi:hypothetical protein
MPVVNTHDRCEWCKILKYCFYKTVRILRTEPLQNILLTIKFLSENFGNGKAL